MDGAAGSWIVYNGPYDYAATGPETPAQWTIYVKSPTPRMCLIENLGPGTIAITENYDTNAPDAVKTKELRPGKSQAVFASNIVILSTSAEAAHGRFAIES